jgi:hypothetical protein
MTSWQEIRQFFICGPDAVPVVRPPASRKVVVPLELGEAVPVVRPPVIFWS